MRDSTASGFDARKDGNESFDFEWAGVFTKQSLDLYCQNQCITVAGFETMDKDSLLLSNNSLYMSRYLLASSIERAEIL